MRIVASVDQWSTIRISAQGSRVSSARPRHEASFLVWRTAVIGGMAEQINVLSECTTRVYEEDNRRGNKWKGKQKGPQRNRSRTCTHRKTNESSSNPSERSRTRAAFDIHRCRTGGRFPPPPRDRPGDTV